MKLLKFALFALTFLTLAPLSFAGVHTTSSVAFAIEPASWILVAIGLVGGGFLHTRRLAGLNLLAASKPETQAPQRPEPTLTPALRPSRIKITRPTLKLRAPSALSPRLCATATAALILLLSAPIASADSFTFSSQAVQSFALAPSSDSLSFAAETGTFDASSSAPFVFQTGDFVIGDSEIPNQVVPFSFQDTITLNGITQTLTIYGQDAVTTTADTLTIFQGSPVTFGNETFTVQNFSLTQTSMGDFAIPLEATVTPEPASLFLLGTGIVVGALFLARKNFAPRT